MIKWYDVVTLCCLVILFAYFIFVLVEVFFAPRPARIKFVRDFKKGRFILLYIMSFPLCYIGLIYAGGSLTESVFVAFNKVVNFAVLKYEYKELIPLMQQSLLYKIAINFIFAFIAVNAVMFALSLIGQYLSLSIHRMAVGLTRKEKLFIFGEREENASIYLSEKSRYKLIIGDFSAKQCNDFYMQKIYYQIPSHYKRLVSRVVRGIKNGVVTVVINTPTDEGNIQLCNLFSEEIKRLGDKTDLIKQLRIFVYGKPNFEEIYLDIVKNSKGAIHYVNKYQQIAVDFIDKYPITTFLKQEHYDKKSGLVNANLNINVLLIGFGCCNKQIFLTSVANNQFITGTTQNPTIKRVNYHIFDKDDKRGFKNLNHNYNRFKIESEDFNKQDYLPLPDSPAEEYFYKLDINEPDFYRQIKKVVCDGNSVNLIIVALGSDLENIDLAKKLCSKNREWESNNCTVFVKSAKYNFCDEYFIGENCHFIGQEKDIFNIEDIVCDKFTKMALLRNQVYDLEYYVKNNSSLPINDIDRAHIKENSERNWYLTKTQFERESSLYCCLSLRSKLNLLGLDCVLKEDDGEAITKEDFFKRYAFGDMPKFTESLVDGKQIVKYDCNYPLSTRRNFAVLEHLRWNSFMISKGFIPASKSLILNEKALKGGALKYTNGKNYEIRRHGNLTNFEGLMEFAKLVSERDNIPLEKADVISYDYQILDDAFWLLDKVGMKIVEIA